MILAEKTSLINNYIYDISIAKTESAKKERFGMLISNLFPQEKDSEILHDFALGAETPITNILRRSGIGRGQADTQYRSIIIEFENNLLKTGGHAEYQLREYLTGNWNSNIKIEFTIIATDCLKWIVYAPDYDSLTKLSSEQQLKPSDVKLTSLEVLNLSHLNDEITAQQQANDFYFFLDRHVFRDEQIPATLIEIRKCFGQTSSVYRAALNGLYTLYNNIRNNSEMKVAYDEWLKFLYIAYGKFQSSEQTFLTHSYLSILAKLLSFIAIEQKMTYSSEQIMSILNGEAFKNYNIDNFCEEDFFRWVTKKDNFDKLQPIFYVILNQLSLFKFSSINEDILKGVYQELIDEDTRHGLGEFYTPDWLCEKIVTSLGIKIGNKILDPSCGSGSFLKAAANELSKQNANISANELNESLYGIDIHPLSVQITKATILMILGKSF